MRDFSPYLATIFVGTAIFGLVAILEIAAVLYPN